MAGEEYRKKLKEWMASQSQVEGQKNAEKPYDARKMKIRAPAGCVAFFIAALLIGLYWFMVANGFWKRFLF